MPVPPALATARRLAAVVLRRVGDVLLPPRCPLCHVETGTHEALCVACWRALPLIERPYCERLGRPFAADFGDGLLSPEAIASPPAYGRARAAATYEGVALDLVHRLKYRDRVDVTPLMGGLMARAGRDVLAGADVLVPVPLHRFRLWRRRFNQSALLADAVARQTGLRHDPFLVVRRRWTQRQVGLTRAQRFGNVQGAFAVPDHMRAGLLGRRVVLVDDVVTTGATVEAVARVLLRAGAASVDVLAFALVGRPTEG